MRDCPYNKFDFKVMDEVCVLTGEKINGAVKCSFDYDEECELYKEAQKPLNGKTEYYSPTYSAGRKSFKRSKKAINGGKAEDKY